MNEHSSPIRTLAVVAVAGLIGAGSLWLLATRPRVSTGLEPGVLPACDSPFTRKLLKQLVGDGRVMPVLAPTATPSTIPTTLVPGYWGLSAISS